MPISNTGRPSLPAALHILRGTDRKQHRKPPVGRPGAPTMPEPVAADALATAHWHRLTDELLALGVLTTAHRDALSAYAFACADLDRVRSEWGALGYPNTIEQPGLTNPDVMRLSEHPLAQRAQSAAVHVVKLAAEFGLTPVTQHKINARPIEAPKAKRRAYVTAPA